jgi:sporulation protein YlmC with PRC-barrel domain
MNRKVMAVMICLAMVGMTGNALAQQQAPVAGTTTTVIGVTAEELVTVVKGWSAKKQIMGKDVYNDKNEKVGAVEDLIIAPDKAVSYAIIGTGGFLGMDKHDVAIRVNQFKMVEGKITLPGATKDAVKAMPAFQYPK